MVFLNIILRKNFRNSSRIKFIDSLRLTVKGGHGGNGVPKYGGVGGQGGCVYFEAKSDISLRNVIRKYRTKRVQAENGEDASKLRILGRRGDDVCVSVPMGVRILDERGTDLGELDEEGGTCLVAAGGRGGYPANSFVGQPGVTQTINLDLKLIADVGLVGFPNAGKSTLLKAISNATPKIASYPFTTIQPQLGVIDYSDYRQITIADLPGLIEGAHANIGLGHKFLKHVERTRLLLLVVDINGFQLSPNHVKRSCLENVYSLNKELELYDASLLDKSSILLINKMDLPDSIPKFIEIEKVLNNLSTGLENCPDELRPERLINFERIIPISAKNIKEIDKVKEVLRDVLYTKAEGQLDRIDDTDFYDKIKERGPKGG